MKNNLDKILKRLLINGLILLIIAIALLVSNIITNAKWFEYLFTFGIFAFSLLFIIKSLTIKKNHKNNL